MFDSGFGAVALLPLYLGLFGFIEPCSIASTLLMVKQMEGQSGRDKIVQMLTFAGTRAIFIGALGAVASGVGAALHEGEVPVRMPKLFITESCAKQP